MFWLRMPLTFAINRPEAVILFHLSYSYISYFNIFFL